MSVVHRITGYDKKTELLTVEHDVPAAALATARELARVPGTDPDAVGAYPLEPAAALRLAELSGTSINIDGFDWFLEPFSV